MWRTQGSSARSVFKLQTRVYMRVMLAARQVHKVRAAILLGLRRLRFRRMHRMLDRVASKSCPRFRFSGGVAMTNLCGHDRDVLRWALELWATVTNGGMVVYSAGTGGAKVAKANAFGDANDPAKLAEMLAARGRELGLVVGSYHASELVIKAPSPLGKTRRNFIWCYSGKLGSEVFDHDLSMPQARAILLQWLQLPDGAREEALQVFHGNHVDPDELLNTIPMHERVEPRRFDPDPDRGRE